MKEMDELEALDRALDALVGREPKTLKDLLETFPTASELRIVSEAAGRTRRAVTASVPPETRAKHVSALMDAARSASGRQVVVLPSRSRFRRLVLRPIAVAAIVASLGLLPTIAMAQSAGPGDALYGTKLAFETLQITLATDPEDDARLHLEFADRRLEELSELLADGGSDEIGGVMSNFASHAAGAEEALDEIAAQGGGAGELESHLSVVLMKHVTMLQGMADDAGCNAGNPDEGPSQCKGLLNAIDNSSKVLTKHPKLDGEHSGQGQGSEGHGPPDNPGPPRGDENPNSETSGPPAGAGRP